MALEATAHASSTDLKGLPRLVGEYLRRRPEATPLYQVIQENYQTFVHLREEESRPLPAFVRREFEKFLTCGQLSEGFTRTAPLVSESKRVAASITATSAGSTAEKPRNEGW